MLKYFLIYIFLCVTYITNAQNTNYSIDKCNNYLKNSQYLDCIIECERILFYTDSLNIKKQALLIKGLAEKKQHKYTKASETFSQLRITNPNDSLFTIKTYQTALCNYLAENYEEAINTITQWEIFNNQKDINEDIILIKILSLNSLFRFKEAHIEVNKLNTNSNTVLKLNKLYHKRKTPRRKNPELSKNMSMIIPGLGQCYSSRWVEGGVSFILNAGALAFGGYHIYQGYYFTGYITGFTLLHKFHSGGMKRSATLAETRNKKNIIKYNQKFIEIWENH